MSGEGNRYAQARRHVLQRPALSRRAVSEYDKLMRLADKRGSLYDIREPLPPNKLPSAKNDFLTGLDSRPISAKYTAIEAIPQHRELRWRYSVISSGIDSHVLAHAKYVCYRGQAQEDPLLMLGRYRYLLEVGAVNGYTAFYIGKSRQSGEHPQMMDVNNVRLEICYGSNHGPTKRFDELANLFGP